MGDDFSKRLYHTNFDSWMTALKKNFLSTRQLYVKTLEHGIILPSRMVKVKNVMRRCGGVCDQNMKYVAGFVRGKHNIGYGGMNRGYDLKSDELQQRDENVIFGGVIVGHFGHFMSECLTRLWYAVEHLDSKQKIAFIVSFRGLKPWHDFFWELLDIPKDRIIYVDKPTQFKSIIVPEQSSFSLESYTKEYMVPYRHIADNIEPGNVKKLYLTRTEYENDKLGSVHIFGEHYFEDYFAKKGFTVISPQKLSLREQISLLKGAEEVAAVLGTLTHWATVCKPGAKFIMLDRTNTDTLPLQCLINQATDIDWCIVDVSKNFLHADRYVGACLLGSTYSWKRFVADYFSDDISVDDDLTYADDAVNKYVKFWCKKYARTEHLSSSLRNMCNTIVSLEQTSAEPQIKSIQYYRQFVHDYFDEEIDDSDDFHLDEGFGE